jgi:hypothetical protein
MRSQRRWKTTAQRWRFTLWIIQHVAKVYTYGWLASMGLIGASTAMVAATFVGLAIVYLIQVRLALAVFGLWRDWLRGRTSDSEHQPSPEI